MNAQTFTAPPPPPTYVVSPPVQVIATQSYAYTVTAPSVEPKDDGYNQRMKSHLPEAVQCPHCHVGARAFALDCRRR